MCFPFERDGAIGSRGALAKRCNASCRRRCFAVLAKDTPLCLRQVVNNIRRCNGDWATPCVPHGRVLIGIRIAYGKRNHLKEILIHAGEHTGKVKKGRCIFMGQLPGVCVVAKHKTDQILITMLSKDSTPKTYFGLFRKSCDDVAGYL